MLIRTVASRFANAKVAIGNGVDVRRMELVELSVRVDEDGALERLLGERIVADAVVGEVVEDLEGEEPARFRDVGVPVEDGAVYDFNAAGVAAGAGGFHYVFFLEGGEGGGYFDDFEFCSLVDVWVDVADVVEDVEH